MSARPDVAQMARDLIAEVRRQDAAHFAVALQAALDAQDPLLAGRALLAEVTAAATGRPFAQRTT